MATRACARDWRTYVAYAAPWEPIPDDGLERYDEGKPR